MMVCRMGSKQQKQKANRRHKKNCDSEPSLLVAIAHNSHGTSRH